MSPLTQLYIIYCHLLHLHTDPRWGLCLILDATDAHNPGPRRVTDGNPQTQARVREHTQTPPVFLYCRQLFEKSPILAVTQRRGARDGSKFSSRRVDDEYEKMVRIRR